jgi:hypothetical protein
MSYLEQEFFDKNGNPSLVDYNQKDMVITFDELFVKQSYEKSHIACEETNNKIFVSLPSHREYAIVDLLNQKLFPEDFEALLEFDEDLNQDEDYLKDDNIIQFEALECDNNLQLDDTLADADETISFEDDVNMQ